MTKSFKSQIKENIKSQKLWLERDIREGFPVWAIENSIENINKLYRQLAPRTKKEEQDFFNFIAEHDQIIKRTKKARIRFLRHLLANIQNEQDFFKTPENIKDLQMELEQLEEELNIKF